MASVRVLFPKEPSVLKLDLANGTTQSLSLSEDCDRLLSSESFATGCPDILLHRITVSPLNHRYYLLISDPWPDATAFTNRAWQDQPFGFVAAVPSFLSGGNAKHPGGKASTSTSPPATSV